MTYFFRFHFFNNSLYIGCTSQIPYFYSYVILFYFSERVGGGGGVTLPLRYSPRIFVDRLMVIWLTLPPVRLI